MAANTAPMPPRKQAMRSDRGSGCILSSRTQNHSQIKEGSKPERIAYVRAVADIEFYGVIIANSGRKRLFIVEKKWVDLFRVLSLDKGMIVC